MNISILGAGTWGIALAKVLSANHSVMVWSHTHKKAQDLSKSRIHEHLSGIEIPQKIVITSNIQAASQDADVIIIATPSIHVRNTCKLIKNFLNHKQIICCVSKGIEPNTLYFMDEVIEDTIGMENPIVALSGPTHAEEVAQNKLSLIVSSSINDKAARTVQHLFLNTCIRPYTNNDIKGVELCGALKNIISIACGISIGLGYGDNTKAALITRGISEMKALGYAMGFNKDTFSGLAGIGDLIVTATSTHSRNNKAGIYIGQGFTPNEAIKKVGMVVEGINALPAAIELAKTYNVELPITFAIHDIVNNNKTPKESVKLLFSRTFKNELM